MINEAALIESSIDYAWLAGANEVIVADGGSCDETVSIAKDCDCRLVESETGRARQMNAGANAASGDVFLFLHADTRLVEDGCEQIRRLPAGLSRGGFKQRIESRRIGYRLLELGNNLRARFKGMLYGDQGLFFKRELFQRVGGFPDEPFLEDLILSDTLNEQGERAALLSGPLKIDARRWEKNGIISQTRLNWSIIRAYRRGTTPQQLASRYRRHDK